VLFNRGSAKHVVGFREFQGFREGSPFYRGIIFCFSMLMRLYEFFRSPCHFQTPSSLVSCTGGWMQIAEQEILRVVALFVVQCCAYCCITVARCCRCTVHSGVGWVESRLVLRLVGNRLSHRLDPLFNLCRKQVNTVWNPTFYYLVKPGQEK